MAKVNSNPKTAFFWQTSFILLPVAALACFGLYSLRQDRLLADQDAREAGAVLAQRLAQAISTESLQQLRDYRDVSSDLWVNRTADLGQSIWGGGAESESNAWQRIKAWQQANPDDDLAAEPPSDGYLVLSPPTMLPHPPEWLTQLNPEQQRLWQAAKDSEFAAKDFPDTQTVIQKFIASDPPAGARANAEYLLLLAKTRGLTGAEAVAPFAASMESQSAQLTDAGLPVGQLIWYQWLRLLPNGAGLPEKYVKAVAWAIYYRPSFFSARLVAELERVTKGTKSTITAATVKAWWDAEEKAWMVREAFREQHPTNTWTAAPFWVDSDAGTFLLVLGDLNTTSTNYFRPPSKPLYVYLMFPQAVVEKALGTAVIKSDISLPPYALVEFELGGKKFPLSHPATGGAANVVLPMLGQAGGTWSRLPWNNNTNTYPFRVRVLLASPEILYARQSQRNWMFGGLIVVAAVAAIIALFAADRSFRRQQQLTELKTNFVSSVSHELRAPIASVRLMAENLERGKIPDASRQGEYFRFIVQECRRLSALIENVLDFSRIEQGRKQYEFEPTDLVALVQTTVKLMEPGAAEKGVRLEFHSELPAPNSELDLDGRALQQALVNLIDNALKHSPKGETVTVGLEQVPRRAGVAPASDPQAIKTARESGAANINMETAATAVLLSVTDHGPGIPRAEHEKIFERFYRLGSELRRETQGVGIGLSIVQHIVAAHGGRVRVDSEPGHGSRFTIELPAKNPTTDKPV